MALSNVLGCGSYTAQLWSQGGAQLLYDDLRVASASWARVLSDTSDASVTLEGLALDPHCLQAIRYARSWRDELALVRDGSVVWQGPVTGRDAQGTAGSIQARDLSWWWDHRYLPNSHTYDQVDLATIFNELATDALSEDTTPNITVDASPTGVLATRSYRGGNYLLAGPELREVTKSGVDWTFVVRTARVGGLVVPATPIVLLQDEHLAAFPKVAEDGSVGGNRQTFVGAGGGDQDSPVVGQAADAASVAAYGLVDEVTSQDRILDSNSATAAAANRLALVSEPAIILSEVVLNQTAPILLELLVPGAVVGVAFDSTPIPVSGQFRIQKVAVTVAGEGELVTLALQPLGAGGDS